MKEAELAREDARYYEHRAEQEIEAARQAPDPRVVDAHYRMATEYLDRLYPEADEPA